MINYMYSADFHLTFSNYLPQLTSWYAVAIAAALIVFFVSIRNDSGIIVAAVEALLAAAAYQASCQLTVTLMYADTLPFLEDFSNTHPWFAAISPVFLFVPFLILAVCLAIGSANNDNLRFSYIFMHTYMVRIMAVFLTVWMMVQLTVQMGIGNGLASCFIMLIIIGVGYVLYFTIQRMILKL